MQGSAAREQVGRLARPQDAARLTHFQAGGIVAGEGDRSTKATLLFQTCFYPKRHTGSIRVAKGLKAQTPQLDGAPGPAPFWMTLVKSPEPLAYELLALVRTEGILQTQRRDKTGARHGVPTHVLGFPTAEQQGPPCLTAVWWPLSLGAPPHSGCAPGGNGQQTVCSELGTRRSKLGVVTHFFWDQPGRGETGNWVFIQM